MQPELELIPPISPITPIRGSIGSIDGAIRLNPIIQLLDMQSILRGNVELFIKTAIAGTISLHTPDTTFLLDKRHPKPNDNPTHQIDLLFFGNPNPIFASEYKCTFDTDTQPAVIAKAVKQIQVTRAVCPNIRHEIVHVLNCSDPLYIGPLSTTGYLPQSEWPRFKKISKSTKPPPAAINVRVLLEMYTAALSRVGLKPDPSRSFYTEYYCPNGTYDFKILVFDVIEISKLVTAYK